jgi:hypothetical protein
MGGWEQAQRHGLFKGQQDKQHQQQQQQTDQECKGALQRQEVLQQEQHDQGQQQIARGAGSLLARLWECKRQRGGVKLLHLLLNMMVGVGAEVSDSKQQQALLQLLYKEPDPAAAASHLPFTPPPPSPAAAGAVMKGTAKPSPPPAAAFMRPYTLMRTKLASSPQLSAAVSSALISISNRMSADDGSSRSSVVLTKAQQAAIAADLGKAFLPYSLLWPGDVVKRLLLDGMAHRCVVVVQHAYCWDQ